MTGSDERRSDAVALTPRDDKINNFVSFAEEVMQANQLNEHAMIMIIDFIAINLKASIDRLDRHHRGPAAVVSAKLAPMLSEFLTSDNPEEMWTLLVDIDQRFRRACSSFD